MAPGPARVAEVQAAIRNSDVNCLIAEPGQAAGLVKTVLEGTGVPVLEISPLSAEGGYVGLLTTVADGFALCAE